ncbi:MAG: PAS domain-containing protein [Vicinamibacterales bacterium]
MLSDPSRRRRAPVARGVAVVDDRFFRHLVAHMRNGVLAIDRDGTLALINDEACRDLRRCPAGEDYIGRPFAEVFRAPAGHRPRAGRRLRAGDAAEPR